MGKVVIQAGEEFMDIKDLDQQMLAFEGGANSLARIPCERISSQT